MLNQNSDYVQNHDKRDNVLSEEDRQVFPLQSILGFFGYSAFVSWVISFFFYQNSPFLSPFVSSPGSDYMFDWYLLLFFAVSMVAFIAIALFCDIFMSLKRLLILGGLVVAALAISFIINIANVHIVSMAIAFAGMTMLWSFFLGTKTRIFLYSGGAVLIGGALGLLVSAMATLAATIVILLMPVCSMALFFILVPTISKNHEFVCRKESKKRFNPPLSGKLTTMLDGALFGLVVYLLLPYFNDFGWLVIAVAAVFIIVGAIILVDYKMGLLLSESVMLKTFVLRCMPPVFFLAFFTDQSWVAAILLCYLLLNLLLHFAFSTAAAAELVRFNQLNGLFEFSSSKALVIAGIIVGIISAWIFRLGDVYQITVVFIYLLMICAFSAFVFRDNYPTIEREMGVDIDQEAAMDVGNWRRRIERTASEFHLSPRQTEVFFMLAKGRNAEHMQKEFFISKATAKAHIYSIYRKTGVHSQQELIDLIESKSDVGNKKKSVTAHSKTASLRGGGGWTLESVRASPVKWQGSYLEVPIYVLSSYSVATAGVS